MLNQINNNQQKALFLAKKQLSEIVCAVVNLEGINYTIPEIQTLLDGITVGGHRQSDEEIAKNQIDAWRFLFASLENASFEFSKKFVLSLHKILANNEALVSGKFRDGGVFIAETNFILPDFIPPNYKELDKEWQKIVVATGDNKTIYQNAISVFLQMARNQFFYDGNKRTGRMMMNGILLKNGLPIINLTAKKQLEFNNLMLDFYKSGIEKPMQEFMLSCLDERILEIMK
jgi:Fic family protein